MNYLESMNKVIQRKSETIGLTFSDLKEGISWFNPHLATFVFRNAGMIELDFEVEP